MLSATFIKQVLCVFKPLLISLHYMFEKYLWMYSGVAICGMIFGIYLVGLGIEGKPVLYRSKVLKAIESKRLDSIKS